MVLTEKKAECAPVPVWPFWREENLLPPVGNRAPDRPEQSLYILSYPVSISKKGLQNFENLALSREKTTWSIWSHVAE